MFTYAGDNPVSGRDLSGWQSDEDSCPDCAAYAEAANAGSEDISQALAEELAVQQLDNFFEDDFLIGPILLVLQGINTPTYHSLQMRHQFGLTFATIGIPGDGGFDLFGNGTSGDPDMIPPAGNFTAQPNGPAVPLQGGTAYMPGIKLVEHPTEIDPGQGGAEEHLETALTVVRQV